MRGTRKRDEEDPERIGKRRRDRRGVGTEGVVTLMTNPLGQRYEDLCIQEENQRGRGREVVRRMWLSR